MKGNMPTATKKPASRIAPASKEKATKANDNTAKVSVAKFDIHNPPKGITVSQVGTFSSPEYLISHDGINDDGTVSAGWACRTSQVDDIPAIIKYRGVIPE